MLGDRLQSVLLVGGVVLIGLGVLVAIGVVVLLVLRRQRAATTATAAPPRLASVFVGTSVAADEEAFTLPGATSGSSASAPPGLSSSAPMDAPDGPGREPAWGAVIDAPREEESTTGLAYTTGSFAPPGPFDSRPRVAPEPGTMPQPIIVPGAVPSAVPEFVPDALPDRRPDALPEPSAPIPAGTPADVSVEVPAAAEPSAAELPAAMPVEPAPIEAIAMPDYAPPPSYDPRPALAAAGALLDSPRTSTTSQDESAPFVVQPPVPPASPASPAPDDEDRTILLGRTEQAPWLLVLDTGERIAVPADSVVLGRKPALLVQSVPGVTIPDVTKTLSKVHARLDRSGESWVLTDLGSTNGSSVIGAGGGERRLPSGGSEPVRGRFLLGETGMILIRNPEAQP